MANATDNLIVLPYGKGARENLLSVDGGAHLYKGTLISQLNATGMACPGSTASSGPAVGVALHEIDNSGGSDEDEVVSVAYDGIFIFANATAGDACSDATPMLSRVYMYDDHTIADNSNGGARQPAGLFIGMESDGKVRVFVGKCFDAAAGDAAEVAIADAGTFTAESDVEGALQEIYQGLKTAQAQLNVPLGSFVETAGTPLVAFANAADPTPGWSLDDSEAFGIRWNNHATPDPVVACVAMPQDLDDTAAVVVHIAASKTGATLADATTFTIGAFFQTIGAARDADADCGGASSAMTGDATTKTVQELTLSLAAGDVPAAPCVLTLTLQPTDGLLGTDDVTVHAVWLEYTRKILTS